MSRGFGPALACLCLAACGSSPTSPSPPPQTTPPPVVIVPGEMTPGAYRLTVFAGGDADRCAGRAPSLGFPVGTVMVAVTLARDGDDWTARASGADGDLELRYPPPGAGAQSMGVLGGTGNDYLNQVVAVDRGRVTIKGARPDEPGVTDVRVVASAQTAIGMVTNGSITFETPGGQVTCEQARWILRPATL